MTRNSYRLHGVLSGSAITGAALAAMLVGGPALAEGEGGAPEHHGSFFQRMEAKEREQARAARMPSKEATTVVEARAGTEDDRSFHDKTPAEWRAYRAEQRAKHRRFGR